ncbi:MAG: hypothetical protein AAF843_02225 [Bacteroidota bacterium]
MIRIRVKVNSPSPSLSTLRQYRDFDGFLKEYRQYYSTSGIRHMLYNDRKKLIYIVIIILFLLMLLFVDDISAQALN